MKKSYTALLLACVLTAAASLPARASSPAPSPTPATQPAPVHNFPSYGIRFASPVGWKRIPPANVDTIANWVSLDNAGNVVATLLVQHRKIRGTILDDERAINGRMTLKSLRMLKMTEGDGFWAKGSTTALASLQEFECRRGNAGYRVSLARQTPGTPGEDDATMKAFIDSWQFRELEEPWEHSRLAETPLSVPGEFFINVPTDARPEAVQSALTGPNLAIVNLKTQQVDLRIIAFTRPAPVPTPEILAAAIQSQLAPGAALQFTDLGNNRSLSGWAKSERATLPSFLAFAIVPIANNQSAIVTFSTDRTEPNVQAAYLAVARQVTLSIQPANAANLTPVTPTHK